MSACADANVRASHYFVAEVEISCAVCGAITPVYALLLPVGHESADPDENSASPWVSVQAQAVLFGVTGLSLNARQRLQRLAPLYRADVATGLDFEGWRNHCQRCGAALDEQWLHEEPGNAFVPMLPAQAQRIVLWPVFDAIEAQAGGYALSPAFFEFARAVP